MYSTDRRVNDDGEGSCESALAVSDRTPNSVCPSSDQVMSTDDSLSLYADEDVVSREATTTTRGKGSMEKPTRTRCCAAPHDESSPSCRAGSNADILPDVDDGDKQHERLIVLTT